MSMRYRGRFRSRAKPRRFVWSFGVGPVTYSKTGSLAASGLLSGVDVFTAAEAGSLIGGSLLSGADVFTAAETGSLIADTELSGTRSRDRNRTGSLFASGLQSGADSFTAAELGSLIASGQIRAVRVVTFNRLGALLVLAELSGTSELTSSLVFMDPIHTGHVVFGTTGGFFIQITGNAGDDALGDIHEPHEGHTHKVEEGVAS